MIFSSIYEIEKQEVGQTAQRKYTRHPVTGFNIKKYAEKKHRQSDR